ncbi:hypothetical protein WT67_24895 [Burkholderia stagnalis]|uniref:Uncharacterized protein n=1 Tax=Burkholderia stagnalis TaxID=1503054 RepID=A0A6L3MKN5_9BURK|nr:hypothetical protein [Burkholderia stagnalis]KAB0631787.1 hypothetical protein F7R25_35035 [Burkholderia stagnalis]KVO39277.1 hypothetical protein WT17_20715 [Burkholderia stagnalis]KVO74521.1 hypothetical protein WT19_12055 [Burkholderia stagnalis]KVW57464.1 hypothetical protein WT28_25280 [Burkholderia stagnalis]KVW71253.1 hypothetical protein WT29_32105 [Burkholderia stagnalis]
MAIDIQSYLSDYVARIKCAIENRVEIESSNSGFYQSSLGGTAYVSFYPKEIDFTLDLIGVGDKYTITADLTDQEGKVVSGDIFKFDGNPEYLCMELDAFFPDLVKLVSDRL